MMAKFDTFAKYAIFLKIVTLKGKPLHIEFRQSSGDFLPPAPFSPLLACLDITEKLPLLPELMKYMILGKFGGLNLTFSKK